MIETVWVDWDEWKEIYHHLYSDLIDNQILGLKRLGAWRSRGALPIAVESTGAIVEARLYESRRSETENVSVYSMAFNRLVNGFIEGEDNERKRWKVGNTNMFTRAQDVNMPSEFVDLRHEISHGRLPSLSLLRIMSKMAFAWVEDTYWKAQLRNVQDTTGRVIEILVQHRLSFIEMITGGGDESSLIITKKEIKKTLQQEWTTKGVIPFYDALQKEMGDGMLETVIVPQIIQSMLSTNNNNNINNNNNNNNQSIENITIYQWKPILSLLHQDYPNFYPTILYLMTHQLSIFKNTTKTSSSSSTTTKSTKKSNINQEEDESSKRYILLQKWIIWIIENLIDSSNSEMTFRYLLEIIITNHLNQFNQIIYDLLIEKIKNLDQTSNNGIVNNTASRKIISSYKPILKEFDSQHPKKWRKIQQWSPCPIGALPWTINSQFEFPSEVDQFSLANFFEMKDQQYQTKDYQLVNNPDIIISNIDKLFPSIRNNNNQKQQVEEKNITSTTTTTTTTILKQHQQPQSQPQSQQSKPEKIIDQLLKPRKNEPVLLKQEELIIVKEKYDNIDNNIDQETPKTTKKGTEKNRFANRKKQKIDKEAAIKIQLEKEVLEEQIKFEIEKAEKQQRQKQISKKQITKKVEDLLFWK
ncbi:las1-like protein [Cavenderia fasciculata]|uniref:Las1-like protein n=1 Tax=Cavenderia fasciculata TaxID=261658 RepID=F4Q9A0_CACFS|nr:las1-like protein [Cavenderia fasciculata]EGG15269.1 las1-like protein [Cavenderia fasciculata]|eukprot:XP_004351989.1 las1-like protein [Cavenderia fasciculata]